MTQDTKIQKLNYIDAARGIAILMVVFIHTAQSVDGLSSPAYALAQYGQMGVQLFFVASAYTLCRTYSTRRGESVPIEAFAIRRFFRIAPLYYVGIVFYWIVYLATRPLDLHRMMSIGPYSPVDVLANVLFVHGFVPSAMNSIVPGGWSIGTEMAFYCCFPILYELFAWLTKKGGGFLTTAIFGTFMVSFMFALVVGMSEYGIAYRSFFYFNLVNQLPVFMLGMAAFFLQQREIVPDWIRSTAVQATGFVVFSVIAAAMWDFKPQIGDVIRPAISGLSFFCLLNLLRLWEKPPALLCTIGRVSFSMYLFHFVFAKVLLGPILKSAALPVTPDLILFGSFVLVSAVTLSIAIFTERTIEKRGIAFGNKLIKQRQETVGSQYSRKD